MNTSGSVTEIRRHRGLDVFLLVLAAVVVGGLTASVAVAFGGERVVQVWAAAAAADDGSARVTEVIDWDFGPRGRHGIFRDVPGLRGSAPIEVSSPDAPATVDVSAVDVSAGSTARIRIGDPQRTVRGLHRYVLTYTVDGVVRGGELAWNVVGTSWQAPVGRVEAHVTAPTALTRAACTTGPQGSHVSCGIGMVEPGHLVTRVAGLGAGEGVTVSATTGAALASTPALPAPPAAAASTWGVSPVVPGVLAAVVALLFAAVASQVILWAGREFVPRVGVPVSVPGGRARIDLAELARHVVPSPSLPAGLSPAEGGVLIDGRVLDRHKAAWLIDQAVAGVIDLIPVGTPAKEMTIVRLQPGDPAVARLLDIAFAGRDRLTLGVYDRDFARTWDTLGRTLTAWQGGSGLWDADADRRARWARALGALTGVVGLALALLGGYLSTRQAGLPLLLAGVGGALAGAGAAGAVRGWELRVFTPEGAASWLQVESLRRFLAQSPPTAVDEVIASPAPRAVHRLGRRARAGGAVVTAGVGDHRSGASALRQPWCAVRRLRADVHHPLLHLHHDVIGVGIGRRWRRGCGRRRGRRGRRLLVSTHGRASLPLGERGRRRGSRRRRVLVVQRRDKGRPDRGVAAS